MLAAMEREVLPSSRTSLCIYGVITWNILVLLRQRKNGGFPDAECWRSVHKGVSRLGTIWMIPSDAEKPADARIKSGKYIGCSAKYRDHTSEKSQMQKSYNHHLEK